MCDINMYIRNRHDNTLLIINTHALLLSVDSKGRFSNKISVNIVTYYIVKFAIEKLLAAVKLFKM